MVGSDNMNVTNDYVCVSDYSPKDDKKILKNYKYYNANYRQFDNGYILITTSGITARFYVICNLTIQDVTILTLCGLNLILIEEQIHYVEDCFTPFVMDEISSAKFIELIN